MLELISESNPKANKNHKCMFCNGTIKKGEVYNKQIIKGDYIYTWKNHSKCSQVYEKLDMSCDYSDGIDPETFMEYVYNFLYENTSEEERDGLFGEKAVDKVIEILARKES